jgi:SAM-dependent methyltransferase
MRSLERIRWEFLPPRDDFDRLYGIHTAGVTSLRRLRVVSQNKREGVRHQPVDPDWFERGIREIPNCAEFTFVDMGCGKGRGLVLARRAGFERIVGVEFAPALARTARRNLRKLGLEAEIVVGDAATYVFRDEPTVLFLYNPFGKGILSQVHENLQALNARLYVLYVNPVHADVLAGFDVVLDEPDVVVLARGKVV